MGKIKEAPASLRGSLSLWQQKTACWELRVGDCVLVRVALLQTGGGLASRAAPRSQKNEASDRLQPHSFLRFASDDLLRCGGDSGRPLSEKITRG